MKKYLLLATALAAMTGNAWAEVIQKDNCGVNCSYALDTETGLLRVYPTNPDESYADIGPYYGFEYSPFWNSEKIKKLIVEDGITEIKTGAFARNGNMESVALPDSLKNIGLNAFWDNSKLSSFIIPDSTEVVDSASIGGIGRQSVNFYCSGGGNLSKCQSIIEAMGIPQTVVPISRPNYKLDENGNIVGRYEYDKDENLKQLSLIDGSSYIYNKDGELVGIKGKKIYTVEEAEAVTAHGDRFHVSLTYK